MLNPLEQTLEELREENKRLRLKNEKLEILNSSLTVKLQNALRRLYGRSSEKINPDQLLFDFIQLGNEATSELEKEEAQNAEREAQAEAEIPARGKKRGGRKPLPKELPVVEERIEPAPNDLICSMGSGCSMVKIGEKVTEELDYTPAQWFIRKIIRPVYACPTHHEGVVVAPLPPRPIERGRPGPGLLAHLAVSKYADHLPLYRLEEIFRRSGLSLSRKTMCDWLGETAGLLEPIVMAQAQWILKKGYLQADETPLEVMDPAFRGKTRRGYLWVYTIPWAEVVFEFKPSRAREGPTSFLKNFKGHLQTDGYAGYNEVVGLRDIVHLGCWAHARRGFYKAKPYHPLESKLILGMIQKLYHIEREAKALGLDPSAKVALRQRESLPLLEALKEIIVEASSKVLPESLLGKAAQYTLGRWEELKRYVEVGEAEIDNNSVENAIRSVAIGRKNWLFLGHPEGGGLRAEVFYSLIGTCRRLGANPFEYMKDVINRVSTHPASRVTELLPRFWLQARQESPEQAAPKRA